MKRIMKREMKKRRLVWFVLGLALGLMTMGWGEKPLVSVQAAQKDTVLKSVGTIKNASDYQLNINGYFQKKSGDGYLFYNLLGKPLNKEPALECKTLWNDNGDYYILKREGKDLYEVSLVSGEGEELIPYGPALIDDLGDRYAEVYYVDGKTENKDEAVVFVSSGTGISIVPSEEDTLYTGEVKVYDLEKKQFVKGLSFKKPTRNLQTAKDTITGYYDDGTGFICDAGGKDISGGKTYVHNGNIFFERTENGVTVYDDKLKELFAVDNPLYSVYSLEKTPSVVGVSGERKYGFYSRKGEKIVEPTYETPLSALDEYALSYQEGDNYGLIDASGKIITKAEYHRISPTEEVGFYCGEKEISGKKTYDLLTPGGVVYEGYEDTFYSVTPVYKDDASKKYRAFVVADLDFTLENEEGIYLRSRGIAEYKDKTGKSGIYELVEGDQILDCKYEKANVMCGYLYMETEDDKYEVYEIQY